MSSDLLVKRGDIIVTEAVELANRTISEESGS